jgi:hypothetical protein
LVIEARDGGCEGEELVGEGGCEGLELGVVGVLGVVGAAPCCWLGWDEVLVGALVDYQGWEGVCVHSRAGLSWKDMVEAVEVVETGVGRV